MISVLLELQRLKRLDRTGWVLRGLPPGAESVAAHSYGVALTAMLLADECAARGAGVDAERVLRLALLHDLQETRTGDMPRTVARYYGADAGLSPAVVAGTCTGATVTTEPAPTPRSRARLTPPLLVGAHTTSSGRSATPAG